MGVPILNAKTTNAASLPQEAAPPVSNSGEHATGSSLISAIMNDALAPLFWNSERIGQTSAWWSHVPFAHWLVAASRPRLFVELGTHTGVSYTTFCEAVRNTGCGARCYAVDTWQGDAHAGAYGEEVHDDLRVFNEARYGSFSELIRARFDDALVYFADGSIDLLHIDGLHTYEAVKHDFESWLPKLSDKAVVILHDTNVKRDDFGVYRLFGELGQHYPTFEFSHGFGLGVVAVGVDAPQSVLDLCAVKQPERIATLRDRFAFLGTRWLVAAREALVINDLHARIDTLQAEYDQQHETSADQAFEIARLMQKLQEARENITALTNKFDLAQNAVRVITADLAKERDALASARNSLDDKHATLDSMAKQASEDAARIEDLAMSIASLDAARAEQAQQDAAEIDRLAQDLQDARKNASALTDELELARGVATANRADLARDRDALASVRSALEDAQGTLDHLSKKASEDAARIEDFVKRTASAEAAVIRAEGQRNTAERMRQSTVQRVAELRNALDTVGQETTTAREMSHALARRYSAALAKLRRAQGRDPVQAVQRALDKLKRTTPTRAKDLFDLENSIYFDPSWYLETYADVKAEGLSPALHYLLHGAAEQRDPGPWFSTAQYLRNNPDVFAAGANALLHYLRHGELEGRTAHVAPSLPLLSSAQAAGVSRVTTSCIFITGEPDSAGHRYRVLDFIDAAVANGVAASWVRADELAGRHDELAKHDIAFFWRVAWTDEVGAAIAHLRYCGRKIVFDVDDLMTEPNLARLKLIDGIRTQSLTEEGVRGHYERVRRTMLAADACMATTEELALYMRGNGKTTYVVSNGFNPAIHARARAALRTRRSGTHDGLIRIGYAGGSRTHQRDFKACVAGVAQILKEVPATRLVLFSANGVPLTDPAEFPELSGLVNQIEWRTAVPLSDLPEEMVRFDINLAPLEFGNAYCEAKSELKFFEAALVEVPTIASPTGPFRRAIQHGRTGFLAASADDWLTNMRQLVKDGDLRATVGKAAYQSALAQFGPEMKALRFGNVLEQLRGGPGAARAFAFDTRLVRRSVPALGVYPSDTMFEHDKLGSAQVTVVVPLYNYEDFVEETLDSVVDQTDPVLDLVIVDGHSTDDSLNVACRWAARNANRFNRLIVLQNSANYGLGFCRNSGFDAAETPYVVLLDADNKLAPEACTELAEHARRTGAAFVYPTIQHFGASTAVISNAPFEAQKLTAGNYIDAMALVSKEAWAMVGGVDHVRHGWEDYDFWCRIAELGLRGEWLDRPLGLYRVHPSSMQTIQTTVPDNHRRLLENYESRHPWVWLNGHEPLRQPPAMRTTLLPDKNRTRLDRLLPLLRCPVTHQKLGYNADRSALHSYDGFRVWPIRNGRPVFRSDAANLVVHPPEHESNSLPQAALDIIHGTKDWVLNLSAGGTSERFDNVIEAEYSIFRNTDVVADSHDLPFDDNAFGAVIVLNAFEHYRNPQRVAAELHRIVKPGGQILIVTAFMQPLHEKPWHFYNCTRYGLEEWFSAFDFESLEVNPFFSPNFTMGWVGSEVEMALRNERGDSPAESFLESSMRDIVSSFRDPSRRDGPTWTTIQGLSQPSQEIVAAGFSLVARKGDGIPVYVR
jgi:GT2 family glycosyltransferase/glycosyltransferase involved in cell wall biosynthesis/SAM-dependent methyltransferase